MNINNLDYIVSTDPIATDPIATGTIFTGPNSTDPNFRSIKGGFGIGQLSAFISRANSFSTEPADTSSISMLDGFPEGYYFDTSEDNGFGEFSIVDIATAKSPMSGGGNPAFRSVAGGGYAGNNGIFSFSSSAATAS